MPLKSLFLHSRRKRCNCDSQARWCWLWRWPPVAAAMAMPPRQALHPRLHQGQRQGLRRRQPPRQRRRPARSNFRPPKPWPTYARPTASAGSSARTWTRFICGTAKSVTAPPTSPARWKTISTACGSQRLTTAASPRTASATSARCKITKSALLPALLTVCTGRRASPSAWPTCSKIRLPSARASSVGRSW